MELALIAPEQLEVANTYLQTLDLNKTAELLSMSTVEVSSYLRKTEIKNYINTVFMEQGYINKFRLSDTLNDLIQTKLDELREAGVSSNKDILELLQFAHKMRIDELQLELQLEKAKATTNIKNQKNVQINAYGENYAKLMEELTK
jgi:ribosomal protein S8